MSERRTDARAQAKSLLAIMDHFGFSSQREMAGEIGRETGETISLSTLNRAMNEQNPVPLSPAKRLVLARFLGRRCESVEELERVLRKTGWHLTEEEWAEALEGMGIRCLHGIPVYAEEGEFVGRSSPMHTLATRLAARHPRQPNLVVVTGIPGVGKSRLVAETVRTHRAVHKRYPDGIFWLRLENRDEALALGELIRQVAPADALSEREDPWQVARRLLRDKRVLLILDDADEKTDLNRWASLVPSGGLAVTTRRTDLGAPEYHFPLEPMGLEEGRELLLRHIPQPDVGEEEIRWIVEAVGGLPLALYVLWRQAFWCGGLAPVLREMRHRLMDTLTLGERRERSVRAAFDISYERLSPDAQRLFRFLAGFPPPFPVGPVAYVWGETEEKVREGFRELAQAGLVRVRGADRYEMHGLLLEYAAERLNATPEDRPLQKEWVYRFAEYYRGIIRESGRAWDEGRYREALAAWETHHPHILRGFHYACDARRWDWAWEYFVATFPYLILHYMGDVVEVWGEKLRQRAPTPEDAVAAGALEADALIRLGMTRQAAERAAAARHRAEELLGKRRQEAEAVTPGEILWSRVLRDLVRVAIIEAQARLTLGEVDAARSLLEHPAVYRYSWLPEDPMHLLLWRTRAGVEDSSGNFLQALNASIQALAYLQTYGPSGQGLPLLDEAELAFQIGVVLEKRGEHPIAREFYELAMDFARRNGIRRLWVVCALRRAMVLLGMGNLSEARAALEESLPHAEQEPISWLQMFIARAELARAEGRPEEADAAYRRALEIVQGGDAELWRIYGDYRYELGDTAGAMEAWRQAFAIAYQKGHRYGMGLAAYRLGKHLWEQGQREEARRYLEEAIYAGRGIGNHPLVGMAYQAMGEEEKGLEWLSSSLRIGESTLELMEQTLRRILSGDPQGSMRFRHLLQSSPLREQDIYRVLATYLRARMEGWSESAGTQKAEEQEQEEQE